MNVIIEAVEWYPVYVPGISGMMISGMIVGMISGMMSATCQRNEGEI